MLHTRQRGFTLLEIVLVLVILSIVGAVMMEKFVDLSDGAHHAQVESNAGGLQTAVRMVYMQYRINGLSGAQDNVAGYGNGTIDVNANGYPTDTNNANTVNPARCARLWNGVLMSGPTASNNGAGNSDYRATRSGQTCIYTYQRDSDTVRRIFYNALTGAVTTLNP